MPFRSDQASVPRKLDECFEWMNVWVGWLFRLIRFIARRAIVDALEASEFVFLASSAARVKPLSHLVARKLTRVSRYSLHLLKPLPSPSPVPLLTSSDLRGRLWETRKSGRRIKVAGVCTPTIWRPADVILESASTFWCGWCDWCLLQSDIGYS